MAAVAQIDIIINDKDASAGVERVRKQVAGGLEPAFQKVGQTSNVVLTRMVKDHERARDAASLLSRTLGLEVPRQLEKVLAKSALVGPALAAAFNVAVFAGLAAVVVNLAQQIPDLVEKIFDWTGAVKANAEAQKALNPALLDQEKQLRALNEQYKLIGLEGSRQLAQSQQNVRDEIARTTAELKSNVETQQGLRKTMEAAKPHTSLEIFTTDIGGLFGKGKENVKRLSDLQSAALLLQAQIRDLEAQLRNTGKEFGVAFSNEQTDRIIKESEASKEMSGHVAELVAGFINTGQAADFAAKNIAVVNQRLGEQPELDAKRRAARIAAIEEIGKLERETAVAILPPWQRADAEIVLSAQERVREIQQTSTNFERQQGVTAARINLIWAETFSEMRNRLADSLEGLFDDITSGNIGQRLLNNFKKLVFQLVAQWILGVNQMRAASAGGFGGGGGGILGTLLGGLLGIPLGGGGGGSGGGLFGGLFGDVFGSGAGSKAGSSVTLGGGLWGNLLGSASGAGGLNLGGGLSAGGGAPWLSSKLPASTRIWGGLGLLAGGLGIGGQFLMGSSNLFGSTLGGAFTGASAGISAALLFPALLPFLGPIAIIAAAIGALFGFFGGKKRQRAIERLDREIKGEIKKIEDAYKDHQVDFDSTIGQFEQLRTRAQQAMHKLGGDTRTRVQQPINEAEGRIRAIEDERKRRQEVIFGPAEFHRGGFVSQHLALMSPGRRGARAFHSGDVVSANLLVGESVLNRDATRRVGREGVDALNAGRGGGGETFNFNLYTLDSKTTEQWLNAGGMKAFVRAWRHGVAEGAY